MRKFSLFSSILGLTFLAIACGKSPSGDSAGKSGGSSSKTAEQPPSKKNGDQATEESGKEGGKVVGPCTLTGDIRSFEISCTKNIQSFTFEGFSSGKTLSLNFNINGTQYDMNIENKGTKLVGSEKLASEIELTIHFTDSSTGSATLWLAK
jgi:hypothetical protein